MNVFIRADASIEIGTGHVMRCYVLAEQLRKRNVHVNFICRELDGNLISFLEEKDFPVIVLPPVPISTEHFWQGRHWEIDAKETIAQMVQQETAIDLLIVDHYGMDMKWEKMLRPYVGHIMVIDDLANRPHECDLLLDQNLFPNMENRYKYLVPPNTKQLLGLKYLLLREEFTSYQYFTRKISTVKRMLVSFGGSDETNETLKTIKALQSLHLQNVMIDVVLGSSNPHAHTIKAYCKKIPQLHLHENIDYVADLMAEADITIGSGGSTTWERCYMRLPTITLETASNQSEILSYLSRLGAVCHLGKSDEVAEDKIRKAAQTLIRDQKIRKKMVTVLNQIMEGFQESFVADEIIAFKEGEGYESNN